MGVPWQEGGKSREVMNGKSGIIRGVALIAALGLAGAAIACSGGDDDKAATAEPAAATQAPAASTKLILVADSVRGPAGIPAGDDRTRKSCVQASKIPVGGQVVWRIRVIDPRTGADMSDQVLASVVVTLSDGQTFTAKYGGHPSAAPVQFFWATSWTIPATYPTGALDYKIVASDKEGRTGQWDQFKVASAMLQIVATDPWVMTSAIPEDLLATR
jgi:hypothetical protein